MDRNKINRDGTKILVRRAGNIEQNFIRYMNSTNTLYCNGVAKISVQILLKVEHIQQKYTE